MKSNTSSLELYYLVRELKQLENSRLNKVYGNNKDFLFDFHKTGEGKSFLRLVVPDFVYLTKYKPEFGEPSKFCMFLRKHLSGAFLKEINQHGFDRILELKFEAKEKNLILIVELFSRGNVILCEEDMKIIYPMQPQSWGSRTVRGGIKYEYPPKQTNPLNLSSENVKDVLVNTKMDQLVKFLAVDLGLGKTYAEELCDHNSFDKTAAPDSIDAGALLVAVSDLLGRDVQANSFEGSVYPFSMKSVSHDRMYESFNDAVDEVVSRNLVNEVAEENESFKNKKLEKVKKIVENQEKSILKLEKDAKDNQRKGELIFENYVEISELLENIKTDNKNLSWDEIKLKYESHPLVKEIKEKEGLVVIDI